ncbi:MAG: STAS domain-containing protein [Candidatus Promineifilaceae bacterium]|nr:STAS domain-containing protein [Candidatus Promineifilaceae bacterium]
MVLVEAFTATVRRVGPAALIELAGLIDGRAEAELEQSFHDAVRLSPEEVTLDFGGVNYINSTGIALIVGLLAKARASALPLAAVGLSDHYREIFEITRLSDFIEIRQEDSHE